MTSENINSDSYFQQLLQNVIEKEGFTNKRTIKIKSGSEAGDGFVGNNSAVEIEEDGRILKLFAKSAPRDEKVRHQIYVKDLFDREIYFYETIYPEFLKFQQARKITVPFTSAPKCYLTVKENLNETIILENLKEQGFVLYEKKINMNPEHIAFMFKLYARFHAVSHAMRDQEPQLFLNLTKHLSNLTSRALQRCGFDKISAQYAEDAKGIFNSVEDAYVLARIQRLPELVMQAIANLDSFVDDFSVIAHADCWCNNYLFKYKDMAQQTVPENAKILDWQVAQLNSPMLDLANFFYGVATKDVLANLNFYLKTYYDALSENIREMGSDPEKLYPYSVLESHWKKVSRYGLAMSFSIVRIMLADKNEVPNATEAVETGDTFGSAFLYKIKSDELYKQRVRDVIVHFVNNIFI